MVVFLELRGPKSVNGMSLDPQPNWTMNSLSSEIKTIVNKQNSYTWFPLPIIKPMLRVGRSVRGFVMGVSDEDDIDEDEEIGEERDHHSQICTGGKRFACDDLDFSDESDDEVVHPEHVTSLMNKMKMDLTENAVYQVNKDQEAKVKEDIRKQLAVVEKEIIKEKEMYDSGIARIQKYFETRKEIEQELDLQYRQQVDKELDIHMTALRLGHRIKLETEEEILKMEVAQERKRVQQEEKIRQEKARAEAEMLAKVRAEEAEKEAERKAFKALADRKATQGEKTALALEKHRLKRLGELEQINQTLKSSSCEDFSSDEKLIGRFIKQIRGTRVNVRTKIYEIVKALKDFPASIGIATFAKKMVSAWQNPFARSCVIVAVTSESPDAMDVVLAEFHKACIYTVPKHIANLETTWDSDAYQRIDSTMRLYGALVQTDIRGNNHGIEHGWVWLSRFLNKLSANRATATALNAFLQTAGFGLHQRYKSQFLKLLNVVRDDFLPKLRAGVDSADLQVIIANITAYLDDRMYLKEPEGRTLEKDILSTRLTGEEIGPSEIERSNHKLPTETDQGHYQQMRNRGRDWRMETTGDTEIDKGVRQLENRTVETERRNSIRPVILQRRNYNPAVEIERGNNNRADEEEELGKSKRKCYVSRNDNLPTVRR